MEYLCYNLNEISCTEDDTLLLSAEERKVYRTRGTNYLKTRALLKKEIARRTATEPRMIRFSYSEHGKPLFPGIHFNISHSAHLLCMAFHDAPIGVDIQQSRRLPRMESLASRIMCDEQAKRFRELGCPPDVFFDCWVIAEALVKWAGSTIWQARDFPFILHENHVEVLMQNGPQITRFRPSDGFFGAVAYKISACTSNDYAVQ